MKLKTSLGIDSSGESDLELKEAVVEKKETKEQKQKKETENNGQHKDSNYEEKEKHLKKSELKSKENLQTTGDKKTTLSSDESESEHHTSKTAKKKEKVVEKTSKKHKIDKDTSEREEQDNKKNKTKDDKREHKGKNVDSKKSNKSGTIIDGSEGVKDKESESKNMDDKNERKKDNIKKTSADENNKNKKKHSLGKEPKPKSLSSDDSDIEDIKKNKHESSRKESSKKISKARKSNTESKTKQSSDSEIECKEEIKKESTGAEKSREENSNAKKSKKMLQSEEKCKNKADETNKNNKKSSLRKESKPKTLSSDDSDIEDIKKNKHESSKKESSRKESSKEISKARKSNTESKTKVVKQSSDSEIECKEKFKKESTGAEKSREENSNAQKSKKRLQSEEKCKSNASSDNESQSVEDEKPTKEQISRTKNKDVSGENSVSKTPIIVLKKYDSEDHNNKNEETEEKTKLKVSKEGEMNMLSSDDSDNDVNPKVEQNSKGADQPKKEKRSDITSKNSSETNSDHFKTSDGLEEEVEKRDEKLVNNKENDIQNESQQSEEEIDNRDNSKVKNRNTVEKIDAIENNSVDVSCSESSNVIQNKFVGLTSSDEDGEEINKGKKEKSLIEEDSKIEEINKAGDKKSDSSDEDGEEINEGKKEKSLIEEDSKIEEINKAGGKKSDDAEIGSSMKERKFIGLSSSDEEKTPVQENKVKEKTLKKRSERNQNRSKHLLLSDSSDDEDKPSSPTIELSDKEEQQEDEEAKEENNRSDHTFELSSDKSSDSEVIISRKRRKKSSSDSDIAALQEENKKSVANKRRRVKMADGSSSDEGSGDDKGKRKRKSSVGESPGKSGRKNIKKIKGKDDLAEATIEAAEEEKERRRRVEERQKLFNEVFEIKEAHTLEKLVLDFDPKEKKELLSVNKTLVSKMKPHQAQGVKFMWDSCFESLSEMKKSKGSGCILAHCMGLGKTFQVISLVHTLLSNEDKTGIHTVMVVCPLSTVLNWYNEFGKWLQDVEDGDDIEVFHLTRYKKNPERARELRRWQNNGGVLIMGYEMFRNLTPENNKKFKGKIKKDLLECLVDPGADLIVCDEGHMLKNEQTALSKAMNRVKSLRRIVLTGTPMQNNLNEYHCMVQFVKPNLLGTRKEFLNRFVNPITNGQFVDSTDGDVKIMKRRAHVLHKMLEGLVQRFDYNVLTPFLPPKHEYVVSVCLSELQVKLYEHYLQNFSQQSENKKGGARLFQDWQSLGRIWTHPRVLKMSSDKANLLREKKALEASDSEGSLRDFIDDSEAETTTEESDQSGSDESLDNKKKSSKTQHRLSTRSTRSNPKNTALLESSGDEQQNNEEETEADVNEGEWWSEFIEPKHMEDMNHSGKLSLLFGILKECEVIEDKVLVFSQSLFSLDLIEYFLDKIDNATQEGRLDETLCNHQGNWSKGLDYFRLDGSTSSENRSIWCKAFNREDNPRARLFLISTRAGGLGINLTAANRVIIFDASWNPSHDVQSIFRIFRFGQKKPCYVYRFIAHGTMEEKVYDRQVAKQSMSNRVVDEQQVHRHFSSNDLNELYSFTPPTKEEDRPVFALPKDVLFAEILKQFRTWIEKYHEHDSLLENVIEEELNEEERKLAWEDYENDKKRGFMPATNMNTGNTNPLSFQIEYLRQQLKMKYPEKSEQDLNQILVYQVSILMRQQQMQQQQQLQQQMQQQQQQMQMQQQGSAMDGTIRMLLGQNYGMPYNQMQPKLPHILPKPSLQQNLLAQYQANMQMQQMQQQNALRAESSKQSLLQGHLSQPTVNRTAATGMPQIALDRMMQNYQAQNARGSLASSNAKNSSTSKNAKSSSTSKKAS